MMGFIRRSTAYALVVLLAWLSGESTLEIRQPSASSLSDCDLATLATECNAATHVVVTAQDAHNLASCEEVVGDVLFEPTTADLRIDDLDWVNGTTNCTSIPSLVTFDWPGAFAVRKHVVFVDLPNITEISMPHIVKVGGDFSVEGLPKLETLDLTGLVQARGFRMTDLSSLQSFTLNPQIFTLQGGDVYIQSVAVTSLDSVFNHSGNAGDVHVDHVPNVNHLNFRLLEVQRLNITGNGNLSILWAGAQPFTKMEAGTVAISGVVDFSRNKTSWWNATVDKFYAGRNQFTRLPLDFDHMRSLYIRENKNLATLSFHKNWPDYEWEEIAITGNPLLNLTSGTADSASFERNLTKTWIWPKNDVSNMTFEGPFTNDFLQVSPRSQTPPSSSFRRSFLIKRNPVNRSSTTSQPRATRPDRKCYRGLR